MTLDSMIRDATRREAASRRSIEQNLAFNMPDFVLDSPNWFNHFDRRGDGMSIQELVDALVHTYQGRASRAILEDIVRSLWSNTSRIMLDDFNSCGGIRDGLLDCLGEPPVATLNAKLEEPELSEPVSSPPVQQVLRTRPVSAGQRARSFAPSHSSFSTIAGDRGISTFMPKSLQGGISTALRGRRQEPVWKAYLDRSIADDLTLLGSRNSSTLPLPIHGQQCRALLIGINYYGSPAALRGCINDVNNMHNLITETYGWQPENIRVLTDDGASGMPTRANILNALHWLGNGVRPGDVLFLHFSGHGAQQKDPNGYEEDGMNETILPSDFATEGMISDDLIGELLVRRLPENSRLVAVMDCCHSGTGLDLPFTWNGRSWKEETNPYHVAADVQLFSGCADSQASAETAPSYHLANGAMTTAFCDVLRMEPCPSYPILMARLTALLHRRGFSQKAQLTSSQRFDFNRKFVLTDIVPNSNPNLGRTFRRKFAPRPRRLMGPLKEILLTSAAVYGGFVLVDTLTWLGANALHAAFGG